MNRTFAENEIYTVELIRQDEINDVFKTTNKETNDELFETFPRSMEMTAHEVLEGQPGTNYIQG